MSRWFFGLTVALALAAHARADVIHIEDGDCAALHAALAASTPDSDTTIVLARGGTYRGHDDVSCLIYVQTGHVVVEGSGASLSSNICGLGGLAVGVGASLTLRDANIQSQGCAASTRFDDDLNNDGTLELNNDWVSFSRSHNNPGATMTLRNVTASPLNLQNYGTLYAYNATLFERVDALEGGTTVLANSVLDTTITTCFEASGSTMRSLGGNVLPARCPWATSNDRIASDFGLNDLGDNGGLGVMTAQPTSSSIVRNAGIAQYCEPTDARGIARPTNTCDAGAAEFDAGKYIAQGGMNGIFYDRAANGHYVTIQRVHDDDTALVIWNTFDRNGEQAWIYGVGHVDGRHLHVEMSQNIGGTLQAGGPPIGSSVRAWGTVDIDISSCLSGTMHYASSLASFGSGSFPMDRLAYVSDIGCVD